MNIKYLVQCLESGKLCIMLAVGFGGCSHFYLGKKITFLVTKSCKNAFLTKTILVHLDRFKWFIQYDVFLVHSVHNLLIVKICD